MRKVIVRVPASTSNLGPGFDCLGIALCIYNDVTLTRGGKSRRSHIVAESAKLFFRHINRRPFAFSCSSSENIPRSRGLGSSATIRLGVVYALNELAGNPLDRLAIFRLCAQLEGHPDNAAPASFGGFTVVGPSRYADARNIATRPVRQNGALSGRRSVHVLARDAYRTLYRFEVSSRLRFVLLIPVFEVPTPQARRILPRTISRMAAVKSCANACAITAAFASRDYENLRGAFQDGLHQPFRRNLIPFLPRVITAAERAGALGAFLSGSGSTICAITLQRPKNVGAAMLRAAGPGLAHVISTTADNQGAQILN